MKQIIFCLVIFSLTVQPVILRAEEDSKIGSGDMQEMLIFAFDNREDIELWRTVNDGVMGGLSESEITMTETSSAIFKGSVTLENYGGFASVRTLPKLYELAEYTGVQLRVKGDGKKYQFRLMTNERFDGVSYRYQFETELNEWMIIEIPFEEFEPVFRGRVLGDVAPVISAEIQQFGFLIANNRAEKFHLEIDWIKAYKK